MPPPGSCRYYKGEYKNDEKEGFGVYRYSNGRKYEGTWEAGKMHGEGIMIDPQGSMRPVRFHHGEQLTMNS